jgi:hypothetical protein
MTCQGTNPNLAMYHTSETPIARATQQNHNVRDTVERGDEQCDFPELMSPLKVKLQPGSEGTARYQYWGPCFDHAVKNSKIDDLSSA